MSNNRRISRLHSAFTYDSNDYPDGITIAAVDYTTGADYGAGQLVVDDSTLYRANGDITNAPATIAIGTTGATFTAVGGAGGIPQVHPLDVTETYETGDLIVRESATEGNILWRALGGIQPGDVTDASFPLSTTGDPRFQRLGPNPSDVVGLNQAQVDDRVRTVGDGRYPRAELVAVESVEAQYNMAQANQSPNLGNVNIVTYNEIASGGFREMAFGDALQWARFWDRVTGADQATGYTAPADEAAANTRYLALVNSASAADRNYTITQHLRLSILDGSEPGGEGWLPGTVLTVPSASLRATRSYPNGNYFIGVRTTDVNIPGQTLSNLPQIRRPNARAVINLGPFRTRLTVDTNVQTVQDTTGRRGLSGVAGGTVQIALDGDLNNRSSDNFFEFSTGNAQPTALSAAIQIESAIINRNDLASVVALRRLFNVTRNGTQVHFDSRASREQYPNIAAHVIRFNRPPDPSAPGAINAATAFGTTVSQRYNSADRIVEPGHSFNFALNVTYQDTPDYSAGDDYNYHIDPVQPLIPLADTEVSQRAHYVMLAMEIADVIMADPNREFDAVADTNNGNITITQRAQSYRWRSIDNARLDYYQVPTIRFRQNHIGVQRIGSVVQQWPTTLTDDNQQQRIYTENNIAYDGQISADGILDFTVARTADFAFDSLAVGDVISVVQNVNPANFTDAQRALNATITEVPRNADDIVPTQIDTDGVVGSFGGIQHYRYRAQLTDAALDHLIGTNNDANVRDFADGNVALVNSVASSTASSSDFTFTFQASMMNSGLRVMPDATRPFLEGMNLWIPLNQDADTTNMFPADGARTINSSLETLGLTTTMNNETGIFFVSVTGTVPGSDNTQRSIVDVNNWSVIRRTIGSDTGWFLVYDQSGDHAPINEHTDNDTLRLNFRFQIQRPSFWYFDVSDNNPRDGRFRGDDGREFLLPATGTFAPGGRNAGKLFFRTLTEISTSESFDLRYGDRVVALNTTRESHVFQFSGTNSSTSTVNEVITLSLPSAFEYFPPINSFWPAGVGLIRTFEAPAVSNTDLQATQVTNGRVLVGNSDIGDSNTNGRRIRVSRDQGADQDLTAALLAEIQVGRVLDIFDPVGSYEIRPVITNVVFPTLPAGTTDVIIDFDRDVRETIRSGQSGSPGTLNFRVTNNPGGDPTTFFFNLTGEGQYNGIGGINSIPSTTRLSASAFLAQLQTAIEGAYNAGGTNLVSFDPIGTPTPGTAQIRFRVVGVANEAVNATFNVGLGNHALPEGVELVSEATPTGVNVGTEYSFTHPNGTVVNVFANGLSVEDTMAAIVTAFEGNPDWIATVGENNNRLILTTVQGRSITGDWSVAVSEPGGGNGNIRFAPGTVRAGTVNTFEGRSVEVTNGGQEYHGFDTTITVEDGIIHAAGTTRFARDRDEYTRKFPLGPRDGDVLISPFANLDVSSGDTEQTAFEPRNYLFYVDGDFDDITAADANPANAVRIATYANADLMSDPFTILWTQARLDAAMVLDPSVSIPTGDRDERSFPPSVAIPFYNNVMSITNTLVTDFQYNTVQRPTLQQLSRDVPTNGQELRVTYDGSVGVGLNYRSGSSTISVPATTSATADRAVVIGNASGALGYADLRDALGISDLYVGGESGETALAGPDGSVLLISFTNEPRDRGYMVIGMGERTGGQTSENGNGVLHLRRVDASEPNFFVGPNQITGSRIFLPDRGFNLFRLDDNGQPERFRLDMNREVHLNGSQRTASYTQAMSVVEVGTESYVVIGRNATLAQPNPDNVRPQFRTVANGIGEDRFLFEGPAAEQRRDNAVTTTPTPALPLPQTGQWIFVSGESAGIGGDTVDVPQYNGFWFHVG